MRTGCLALVAGAVLFSGMASAQTRSVYLEELTWYEIRDAMAAGTTTAIIFAGGTEQNGPHMALAKHNVIAHYVAGQMAQRLGNALVYPVLPFSPAGDPHVKTGHMRYPGTITLSSEVFLGVMRQVAESAVAAGFRNVFLMGDHGQGQDEIRLAAQGLDAVTRASGARVFYVAFGDSAQRINAYMKEHGIVGGGHAAVAETAQVRFLDRQPGTLIREGQIPVSAKSPQEETGVGGDPSPATADMGRIFLDYKIENGVAEIRRLLADQ